MPALDIAALSTRANGGLIPHAKHGGKGVFALDVTGSKFEGTGFEKEQIGQIHVALLAGVGSEAGRWNGLSVRDNGDDVALLDGECRLVRARFETEDRFEGFGTRVILADDFKKPACNDINYV